MRDYRLTRPNQMAFIACCHTNQRSWIIRY